MPKTCRDCKNDLPLATFGRDRRNRDGHKGVCKECENVRLKAWRSDNEGGKYEAHREKACDRAALYYTENKERLLQDTRARRRANPEHKAAVDRAYRARTRERANELARKRRAADRDRVNAINRARAHRYAATKAATVARRRATKLQATPAWANAAAIRAIYGQAKQIGDEAGQPMHVDHVVPLVSPIVCGLHVENNLQVLPASLNQSKSNRHWPDMPE